MSEETQADVLLVIFASAAADEYVSKVPEGYDTCVIGPIGDFQSIEDAQGKIMEYNNVVFSHEGVYIDYKVLENMVEKVKSNVLYGIVYSDYIQIINRKSIPRLRRSYKKGKNNVKNKMIPVFGSVFSEALVPHVLAELSTTTSLNMDSYFEHEFDQHIPYHTPEFMFAV